MNKSAKGRRNEWKSIRYLKTVLKYPVVIRSTGSFGDWDLVALGKDKPVMLVQVKSNRRPPLLDKPPEGYDPAWALAYHVWDDYAREPKAYHAVTGELFF